jgi:phosphate transport system substrate-binding protein
MTGAAAETLTADNCANPRFRGSLGEGAASPKDPLAGVTDLTGGGGDAAQGPAAGASNDPAAAGAATTTTPKGATGLVKGGSTEFRALSPTVYNRGGSKDLPVLPVLVFLAALAIPAIAVTIARASKKRPPSAGASP